MYMAVEFHVGALRSWGGHKLATIPGGNCRPNFRKQDLSPYFRDEVARRALVVHDER